MNTNGNGFVSRWRTSLWGRWRRSEEDMASYRRLALQLHYDLSRPDNPRSVLFVTPTSSPLCAHGSAALARCLAEELRRPVLLVDACPKAPEVSHILGSAASRGFTDLLADPKLPLDEIVLPTTHENVWFLAAGTEVGSSQLVPPEDVNAWLKLAESRYDFVLLSGGSVLKNSLALALAPYVGSVLLLAIENETLREDLSIAQDTLSFCKARKVGLVFTTPVRSEWQFL